MRGTRREIQGLRALAVGIVVAYHLWPGDIPGGFVGVDVFFVISGFLITAHLLREVEQTGTVSLTRFWARRIRRLLPAAFTVLAVTVVLAFAVLPAGLLRRTLVEIGASAIYLQNWLLAGNSVDYLAADNVPSLVQHYWSLSVEEQFYLGWPLLIVGALWLASRLRRGVRARTTVAIALGAVLVLSLGYSVLETAASPASAYFITPTRVWEFAVGGLLVFVPELRNAASGALRSWLGWLGLAAIVAAAFVIDGETPFPGAIALLPVLGTALVVYAGETEQRWSTTYLYRFAPVQYLGGISYAVYLWHWPLIVAYPFVFGAELTFAAKIGLLAVTVVLSIAMKRFVEDPARTARASRRRPAFVFMAAGVAVVVGVTGGATLSIDTAARAYAAEMDAAIASGDGCLGAAALVAANDCGQPFSAEGIDLASASEDDYWAPGAVRDPSCVTSALSDILEQIECGETTDPSLTLALVGDSHAQHLLDPVVLAAKEAGWRVELLASPGCSGFETARKDASQRIADCAAWSEEMQQHLLESDDIDLVVFSNRAWTKHIDPRVVEGVWDSLASEGIGVAAIRTVPGLSSEEKNLETAPECIAASDDAYDPCSWTWDDREDFMTDAAAAAGSPATLIDLTDQFCTDGTCHAVIGGALVYFDSHHLTTTYAKTLTPVLGERLRAVVGGL